MQYEEPTYTCSDIDDTIKVVDEFSFDLKDMLESLKKQNEELREWGLYWRDEAERLQNIKNIGMMKLDNKDIVRHPLVGKIVEAYERNRTFSK
mgnify:CR=1 FL=1